MISTIRRLLCRHRRTLYSIAYPGELHVSCASCGKPWTSYTPAHFPAWITSEFFKREFHRWIAEKS